MGGVFHSRSPDDKRDRCPECDGPVLCSDRYHTKKGQPVLITRCKDDRECGWSTCEEIKEMATE